MDDESIEGKIAKVTSENAMLQMEIAKAQSIGLDLDAKHKELREQMEIRSRNVAYLFGLHEQNKEMERENAMMEGREYRDPDDPDCEWPEPPDDLPER